MIWVGWRQQRSETLVAAAVLALLAAVAIPVGLHMASVYSHDGLAACAGALHPGSSCGVEIPSFLVRFSSVNILFSWSTLLPPLAALLLAAPFVLDLDNGTYRLLWTQSITRRRWIVTKLAMSIAAVVLIAVLLSVLATWSRTPLDHLNGRMSPNTYDAEGIVPIADALFVFGVAVALGALWRRTVPALLTAFVAYIAVRAFMDSWLRERLVGAITATWATGGAGGAPNALNRGLVIDQFISDKHGHRLAGLNEICVQASTSVAHAHTTVCRPPNLHGYLSAVYIPAGRFWDLQGIEFGLVAGIGVILILAAAWWTHKRIA
jgi:phosphotransferase system  glucose/maltose/N-acetylglucosamine-specific IIC component